MWSKLVEAFACGAKKVRDDYDGPVKMKSVDIEDEFDLKGLIGFQGSFGRVVEGIHKQSRKSYAVKLVCKSRKKGSSWSKLSEAEIMRKMNHPNLASLHSVYDSKKQLCLVMEKYDGGDLFDEIVKQPSGRLTEGNAAGIVGQLFRALEFMHRIHIVHCDVKPSNIMFTPKGKLKLIDFGCSQSTEHGALHSEVGSPSYMAPEVLRGSYCEKADVWSAGIVLFVLLFGYNPFDPCADASLAGRQKIFARILKGFSPISKSGFGSFFPESIVVSQEAKDLITHLLSSDPEDRFCATEALQHTWFNKF